MCFISLFIFFIYFISLFSPSTITSPRTQLNRVHTVHTCTLHHATLHPKQDQSIEEESTTVIRKAKQNNKKRILQ
jgi:hypothetical protein